MGASNVAAVFAHWRRLTHVPFRALTYMALVSMDDDCPPRYFGGVEALAEALGRTTPIGHGDRVAVSSAMSALVRAGAITVVVAPAKGRRAEYALNLNPARIRQGEPDESRDVDEGSVRVSLTDDQAQPDAYQAHPDICQGEPGPKEQQEVTGTPEEPRSPQVTTSPALADLRSAGSSAAIPGPRAGSRCPNGALIVVEPNGTRSCCDVHPAVVAS